MSPSKIVVIVSGSIAAYKSCELISLLRKEGHEVRVLMTHTAHKFIGQTSLEALSGNPVINEDFSSENLMAHIELGQWCDLALFYPATAQSLNSLASGVGQELFLSFYLAFDFKKPFLVAPAMNTRMLNHPVTQASIRKLKGMGIRVLETESGPLACGETGEGRLLNPAQAYEKVKENIKAPSRQRKKILVTAGGTRETIDGVRTLTNMSSGKTGADLADYFHKQGHQVLLLTSRFAIPPKTDVRVDTYESFQDVNHVLQALGLTHNFDMILHAAAISDYSIAAINTPEGEVKPGEGKMSSQHETVSIQLKRNEKILPRLKTIFPNDPIVVGFKLTSTDSQQEQARAIFNLFTENAVDYVVHNDLQDINRGKRKFLITSKKGAQEFALSIQELAQSIEGLLDNHKKEAPRDLMP